MHGVEGKNGATDGQRAVSGDAPEQEAGPFTPALNSLLSQSFGTSLAGVTLSTGEDEKNRLIRANGHTQNRHISLGSHIKQDPKDSLSMEVIAHETAHALAGSGRQDTLLDKPGDAGETKAYEAGRLFRHYAETGFVGKMPELSPASGGQALIQRHEIEGPFGIKNPAHETMTAEALRRAGLIGKDDKFSSQNAWEYIRGVMWNDDPESMFFKSNRMRQPTPSTAAYALGGVKGLPANGRPGDFSTGLAWMDKFTQYEDKAAAGKEYGVGSPLLARTHFGDMSPLHGMAGKDGESRESTQRTMMMWAELTSKVGIGEISGDKKLSEIKIPGFEMFAQDAKLKDKTVAQFFGCDETGGDVKKRAMGSMMHMIQDSYAGGHAEREDLGNGRKGKIVGFHSYAHQDHEKHGEKDSFQGGYDPKETPAKQIARLDGGNDAVEECTELLKLMNKKGANWEEIQQHLAMKTFALSPQRDAHGAGPGDGFEQDKNKKKAMPKNWRNWTPYIGTGIPPGWREELELQRLRKTEWPRRGKP